jgi:hypothetical protein
MRRLLTLAFFNPTSTGVVLIEAASEQVRCARMATTEALEKMFSYMRFSLYFLATHSLKASKLKI